MVADDLDKPLAMLISSSNDQFCVVPSSGQSANGHRRYGQPDSGEDDDYYEQPRGYGQRQGLPVGAGFGYNPYYGMQQYGYGAQPNLFEVVTKNTAAVFDSVNKQIGQTINAVSRPFGNGFGFVPGQIGIPGPIGSFGFVPPGQQAVFTPPGHQPGYGYEGHNHYGHPGRPNGPHGNKKPHGDWHQEGHPFENRPQQPGGPPVKPAPVPPAQSPVPSAPVVTPAPASPPPPPPPPVVVDPNPPRVNPAPAPPADNSWSSGNVPPVAPPPPPPPAAPTA
uniref:Uncharacterized protein n=1 Tax=Anopheles culicifacies TaxID=139723 RepID=A0A182LTM9_9DIPT